MTGRRAVARHQQKLDQAFARAKQLKADPELISDFARYLCVLVSGFLEQAIIELLMEYTRKNANPKIQVFVQQRLESLTNVKAQKLLEVVGSFSLEWRKEFEAILIDENKDALDSVVALRNRIAHGQDAGGVTLIRISEYYERVKFIVGEVERICT